MAELGKDAAMEGLFFLIERGDFPDDSVSTRHWNRIDLIKCEGNKFQFYIDRHPHLFSRSSVGKASTAFVTISYLYEYDFNTDTVKFIKKEIGEAVIDIPSLIDEEVVFIVEESGDYKELDERFKTKEEVINFAKIEADNYDLERLLDSCSNPELLPKDFMKNVKLEFGKQFVKAVESQWEIQMSH